MPMTTAQTLARLAAAILLPCLLACATAAETVQYPIWWSPALELESLDKIDERRKKRFWPEEYEGMHVYKDGDRSTEPAEIEDCATLGQLSNEGYYTLINNENKIIGNLWNSCTILDLLESARPAKASFVRDFVMTAEALDYLPAMMDMAPSCDWLCRQYRANERRISLRRFEAETDIELNVLSDFKIEARSENWVFRVEILARADFNGDGLEDLLTLAHTSVTEQGTWGESGLFVLSRETLDGVLWALDAEIGLCSDYQCDTHYDEPAALR